MNNFKEQMAEAKATRDRERAMIAHLEIAVKEIKAFEDYNLEPDKETQRQGLEGKPLSETPTDHEMSEKLNVLLKTHKQLAKQASEKIKNLRWAREIIGGKKPRGEPSAK